MEGKKFNRQSIRLPGYDYSQENYYFITICTARRRCLFGRVEDYGMHLNKLGRIIRYQWENIPNRYENVWLDEYVIMPNHVHGIIKIIDPSFIHENISLQNADWATARVAPTFTTDKESDSRHKDVGAGLAPARVPLLGEIIGSFKSLCFYQWKQYAEEIDLDIASGLQIWQRNYFEHIIRNEKSLETIRDYIKINPSNWEKDRNNPKNL